MKCPNCGAELPAGAGTPAACPACHAPLPASVPEACPSGDARPAAGRGDSAGGSWVTVSRCASLLEADAAVTRLRAAGIGTFVPDEHLMQAVAWNLNTYGYLRVQVDSRDLESARQLLEAGPESAAEGEATVPASAVPLSWAMRCFAFALPALVCPGFVVFAVARTGYIRQGFDRKSKELWRWFLAGLAFWFVVLVLVSAASGGSGSRQGL